MNFSAHTKRIVAGRAGYRCSIPGCGRVTIGPDSAQDKCALTGKASHIFSASKGGPRGRGGLTPEEIKSANNAIWLCADHADLVDKNRGARYPSALLVSYKGLQEAKTAREQRGVFAPIGWFQQMTVNVSPLFEPKTTLQFGKVTLIIGDNCLGKSALCDWLAGFGDPDALWRWLPNRHNQCELDIEVLCHMPEKQTVRLAITRARLLKFCVNERECPIQPLPLHFVFLSEERHSKSLAGVDDIELICARLNVDPVTLPNLFPFVESDGIGWVSNLRFIEEKNEDEKTSIQLLVADVRGGWRPGRCFRMLEHHERTRVLAELAIALARFSAQFTPTMLLLDGGMSGLDSKAFNELATHLSSAHHLFQTVIVLPNPPKDLVKFRWAGCEIVRLKKGSCGSAVNQSPL
jgi:ABC-type Mn2+/Zn2+ transport system ATPase subunit